MNFLISGVAHFLIKILSQGVSLNLTTIGNLSLFMQMNDESHCFLLSYFSSTTS